ncbi:MAG TPA: chromosomal replication initiator protein DnaA [Chitinispirillaceae bacterium]|nr:chromosomal replication initiator protein DnaA [Chitinispirillaceae bacterium]
MLANNLSHDFSLASPWQICLGKILEKIGPASFETWFKATDLQITIDGTANILVPNQFFADFIEEHFLLLIEETLKDSDLKFSSIHFKPVEKDWKIIQPLSEKIAEAQSRKIPQTAQSPEQFHPNYTFNKFIVGDGNRMAHAASLAVAEAPGKTSFNPLIIYGGTGLGKTHLLQAIGQFAHNEGTADKVIYLTSEEFTNQYINFVINKKDSTSFYRKFNDVDLLLIDDVQFFSGKPGTQKEFYRIFNKLLLENKQIVLSSDRQPDKIPDMMEHIINRFMGGLISDIQPPNLETRMAILRKKAEIDGLNLPDEVVQFIAGHITSNVRELEGTLIKLIASSSFTGRDITLEVARELWGDAVSRKEERVSVVFIQQKVAEAFDISPNQLTAHTRKRDVALPRSVAMYLCKKWTKQSLRTIGLDFGGRDYSTVIHSFKKIESELEQDQTLRLKIDAIEELIRPLI